MNNNTNINLENKTVLITGATSGIGLEIAKVFARQGAKIAFNGFGNVENAISELEQISNNITYIDSDLEKVEDIQTLVQQTIAKFSSIDILINNAGIQHVSSTKDFSVEMWNKVIAINLSAAFHTIRLCLPYMQEQNWGRIINLASVHGLVASVNKSAYIAAKHGLIGLTKTVGLEQASAGYNVTCNAICPGWVKTPLVEKQITAKSEQLNISFDEAKQVLLSEKQPSKEFVEAHDLANLALFLCSDYAKQVQGASWNMDGGWVAQ
jgi:3-hydroxybutyrate dehydrogenase